MKRQVYKDGWHGKGELVFYVENGELKRGVWAGDTVYPYKWDRRLNCYTNRAGDKAYYSTIKSYSWR